jgi:undecaprenyl-diphosphatase
MRFLKGLDNSTLEWFQNHRTPVWDSLMVDLTAMGGHVVLGLIVFFTIGLLLALRRYQASAFVSSAVLGGVLLVEMIKVLIGRARPDVAVPPPVPLLHPSPSFPSGHSMISAVVYLTLALLVTGRIQGKRVRAYLIGCSLLLTFLVGISRLYLGVHYLTDVLAGWTGGMAWALGWRWVEDHWLRFRERRMEVDEQNGEDESEDPSPTSAT